MGDSCVAGPSCGGVLSVVFPKTVPKFSLAFTMLLCLHDLVSVE